MSINLGGTYPFMPQYFTHGFKRDSVRQKYGRRVGMAGQVEYEPLLDTAYVGNGFQRVIQFAVAVHRQQFPFRGGIPVLLKDMERNIQQGDLIADFCFLAGGLNP